MLSRLPFILMAVAIVAMAIISVIPGAGDAYSSWPMVTLWALVAVTGTVYMCRRRLWRRMPVFLLHVAFVVILAGALTTLLTARSETLHLRVGEPAALGADTVTLTSFEIVNYPGTQAPQDFVSRISAGGREIVVAMNRVGHIGPYALFQTSYDADLGGSTLTVRADRAGTTITYAGYILLALSMLWCVLARRVGRRVAAMLLLAMPVAASATPRTIDRAAADSLGQLYVYHGERIMPLSTLAHDFTLKITGRTSYAGLSPEQFMAGWLFFYDEWKTEPCIKVKGERKPLALTDFFAPDGTYRFADQAHAAANEKFSLVSEAVAGSLWRLYPVADSAGVRWYSPVDDIPADMPLDEWRLVRHGLNYLAELAVHGRADELGAAIGKIGRYQRRAAADVLPSSRRMNAERAFVSMADIPWVAVALLVAGIAFFIWPCRRCALAVSGAGLAWTVTLIALSWIASAAVPLTDGSQTMMWLAAIALTVGVASRRYTSLTLIVGALALCVALMGHRQPQVTQAVPVLRSPLLSVHVLCVTCAYALLAIMALCGVAWMCGRRAMLAEGRRLLEPAVFVLAAGIFIGAVWANQSWGRYWGWDPKEVWALITMLVYALPLHRASLPALSRDKTFAVYSVAAFATVIITYFGVNFLLGGLHSYA